MEGFPCHLREAADEIEDDDFGCAGIALGLFASWLTVVRVAVPGGVESGPWRTDVTAGNPRGNPYTRARVALHGFLALNAGETVYYTATHDGEGRRLDGSCVYRISGHDPDAR